MPRRRPADMEQLPVHDHLPLPGTADLTNGKNRTSSQRLLRFLRTRPITSLLVLVILIFASFITFRVGHTVGTTLVSLFFPSKSPDKQILAHVDLSALKDSHNASLNANLHPPPVNDEQGTLVDGASDDDAVSRAQAKEHASKSTFRNTTLSHCYRKYEPGKLGSPKMLCVTDEFYFDISIASKPAGRMKIGVFGQVVPKSAANFRALATCTGAFANEKLCFRGDSFHRVVTNFVVQGGSKATGRSIYGPTFREEREKDHHSFLEHAEKGVVSWAEYPIGSQFFILIRDEAKYLDNNHVVFGIVTEGMEVLSKMHDVPRTREEPLQRITITDCGDVHKSAT